MYNENNIEGNGNYDIVKNKFQLILYDLRCYTTSTEVALLSKQGASVLYALLTKLNIFSLFLPLAI